MKAANRLIICVSRNFQPIQFSVPHFEAAIPRDPRCDKGIVFLVALEPLEGSEIAAITPVIDAYSGDERERRRRFITGVIAVKKKSPRTPRKKTSSAPSINQSAGKARDVVQAGRDVRIVKKEVHRSEFTPGTEHITEAQASKISDLVRELAERTADASGKANYPGAWNHFKGYFNLENYRALKADEFDEAVSWLKQQKAINRGKLRRRNPDLLRKDYYAKIHAKAKELGWDKEQIHEYAQEFTSKKSKVRSLKELGPNQLKKMSEAIYRRKPN